MKKKVVKAVKERSHGYCEVCGSNQGIELHHIVFGRGARTECENEHSVIALCRDCHRGNYGVHFNKSLDLKLKINLQRKYKSLGYTEKEIRNLMGGKLYE